MKVLLITNEYPFGTSPVFGGAGSHVFYLAHGLAELGTEVLVLTYSGAKQEGSPLENHTNVEVIATDFGKQHRESFPRGALEKAFEVCDKYRPDVIHGDHLQGGFIGLAAAGGYKLPMILTMHKPPKDVVVDFSTTRPNYERARDYASWDLLIHHERIGAHVANSKTCGDDLQEIGVEKSKIEFIPPGVPFRLLQKKGGKLRLPARFRIAANDTVILCPLRPEMVTGGTFLRAAAIVQAKMGKKYNLRFILPGAIGRNEQHRPPGRSRDERHTHEKEVVRELSRLANESGLGESIVFTDFTLRTMWQLLYRAKVCVVPAHREGLVLAVLEAMAVGTPVVASNVSGIKEAIEDGISGFLVPVDDPETLAGKVIEILSTEGLVKSLRPDVKRRVESDFDSRNMAQQHLILYKELVDQRSAKSMSPPERKDVMPIDPVSVMTTISLGLKLVDEFRDLALRFLGKKPDPPSATVEQVGNSIQVKYHGAVTNEVKPAQMNLSEWDDRRYRSLEQRIKTQWALFHELFEEEPSVGGLERARIRVNMDGIKVDLCASFKEMVRIYERTLKTSLPDHYSLYEVCGS